MTPYGTKITHTTRKFVQSSKLETVKKFDVDFLDGEGVVIGSNKFSPLGEVWKTGSTVNVFTTTNSDNPLVSIRINFLVSVKVTELTAGKDSEDSETSLVTRLVSYESTITLANMCRFDSDLVGKKIGLFTIVSF